MVEEHVFNEKTLIGTKEREQDPQRQLEHSWSDFFHGSMGKVKL
jgi:hypothetical protein